MTTNADNSVKCNTVVHDNICGTKCNNNGLILETAPNVVQQLSYYFYFGLILIMVPNAFPDSLLIYPLCAHAVFERTTDRK